jgi:hypothetical protein
MFHAAALLWVAGVSHLLHGDVDTHAMAWLLVVSIPGVLLGAQMSIKVPERALRVAFGVILVLSGLKVADVPQATYVIAVVFGVFVAVFLAWSIRQVFVRRVAPEATP